MSKGYMYILKCSDGSYYTGSTKNLERRLREHQGHLDTPPSAALDDQSITMEQNERGANYTRRRRPVELVYYEEYDRIDTAFYREKQVQGWSRRKKEALINGEHQLLPELAKKVFRKAVFSIQSR